MYEPAAARKNEKQNFKLSGLNEKHFYRIYKERAMEIAQLGNINYYALDRINMEILWDIEFAKLCIRR